MLCCFSPPHPPPSPTWQSLLQRPSMTLTPCASVCCFQVVVADTFTSISTMHLGPDVWCSHRMWLLLAVGLLLLPMCFPRHLSALEYLSGLAVLGFIYTSIAVSFRGIQAVKSRPDPWSEITLFNVDVNALYAISIVVFGFNCHANVVSVFYELEHYPHPLLPGLPASPVAYHSMGPLAPKPYTYKLIGMLGAIITYMTIILLGYTAVGITGRTACRRLIRTLQGLMGVFCTKPSLPCTSSTADSRGLCWLRHMEGDEALGRPALFNRHCWLIATDCSGLLTVRDADEAQ
eukprot:GHUV01046040.1.p1 GENE.GHUV01046040.1~~GHUV01046040.1.p1  ORF type:complete len:290 (+),score=37.00 GHUV01046040.1:273-1142(+)